jgi:hypothetical protein
MSVRCAVTAILVSLALWALLIAVGYVLIDVAVGWPS